MFVFPFAEYHSATPKNQKLLVEQELVNPAFMIGAQSAHKYMRQFFLKGEDMTIIEDGIDYLNAVKKDAGKPESIRKKSLQVLQAFKNMNIPMLQLGESVMKYPNHRVPFRIHDLGIELSPHLVFLVERPDGIHLGAFLFRTCISGEFYETNCKVAAFLLEKYLRQAYANTLFVIDKDLCICIDPINNCWASSPHDEAPYNAIIEDTYRMITQQDNKAA